MSRLPEEIRALALRYDPQAKVTPLARLGGGLRNRNYLLTRQDGTTHVLRVFAEPLSRLNELAALTALTGTGLPVPAIIDPGDDATHPWIVLTLLPGTSPGRGLPRLNGRERVALARQLGHYLGRLHRVPPPRPLPGPWIGQPLAANLTGFEQLVRERCLASAGLPPAETRRVQAYLERRGVWFRAEETPVFVHEDLHADNVLVVPRPEFAISGLVDFERSSGRAPEYDFVMAWWSFPEDDSAFDLSQLGPLRRAFVEGYSQAAPLHPDWRQRFLYYAMLRAVCFLVRKPAYLPFLAENRGTVARLLDTDT